MKTNKENDWKKWCEYLRAHEVESKDTMRLENCVYERSVMYERDGEYYVVGTSLLEGEPQKADLKIKINEMHHKAKGECLGGAIAVFSGDFKLPRECEILYEFDLRLV